MSEKEIISSIKELFNQNSELKQINKKFKNDIIFLKKVVDKMADFFYKGNDLKTNTLDEFKEYFYKEVGEEDDKD